MTDFLIRPGNSGIQGSSVIRAVTPSDTVDLIYTTRGVYVGTAGNLEVIAADGTTVVFTGVPAGSVLPICVNRIKAGNTTASTILALF